MKRSGNFVCLSLGTNLGDRIKHINEAIRQLLQLAAPLDIRISSVYETPPWGIKEQGEFLNLSVCFTYSGEPFELLALCLKIESLIGRERKIKWGPRLIDIDILYFGSEIIEHENLCIPHPHLYSRRFVLEPLAEIAPDFIDPLYQKSIQELLKQCPDTSELSKTSYFWDVNSFK